MCDLHMRMHAAEETIIICNITNSFSIATVNRLQAEKGNGLSVRAQAPYMENQF
jgi:hypothetical protein